LGRCGNQDECGVFNEVQAKDTVVNIAMIIISLLKGLSPSDPLPISVSLTPRLNQASSL